MTGSGPDGAEEDGLPGEGAKAAAAYVSGMSIRIWWRRRAIMRDWRRGAIDYAQARWRLERLVRNL